MGIDIRGGFYTFPAFTEPFSQHKVGLKIASMLSPKTTQKIIFPKLSSPQTYLFRYLSTKK